MVRSQSAMNNYNPAALMQKQKNSLLGKLGANVLERNKTLSPKKVSQLNSPLISPKKKLNVKKSSLLSNSFHTDESLKGFDERNTDAL